MDDKYNFGKITDLKVEEAKSVMVKFKNIYGKN